MDIYITPAGSDTGAGTPHAPMATLEGARSLLHSRHMAGVIGDAPVTVWLHGGVYRMRSGFRLDAADVLPVPVSYRAWPGEEVRLCGGVELPSAQFTTVTDAAVVARIDPAARGKVVRLDLARLGLHLGGAMRSHGFAFPEQPSDPELFINDRPMPVARWPKSDAMRIATVSDSGGSQHEVSARGATFTCEDAHLARWATAKHAVCHGQWCYDWAPSTVPVKAVDPSNATIMLGAGSQYGVRPGKRFFIMHLLEEIGEPGEWYIDREAGVLYLWPPSVLSESRLELSWLEEPLITVQNVRRVSFHDLIIECARGTGVVLEGTGNRLVGCELRNFGSNAISVAGEDNGVIGCHIHDCGQGGIILDGGDRKTLTPSGNFAENNYIHAYNRIVKTYRPGIMFNGVGQRASRNLIHDAPHFAIYLHGNDHRIVGNEICDVCLDTDDAGAFYMGRNPSERGVVLQGNFFHHIGTGRDGGTSAIYIDDGAGGVLIEDNVFFRTGNRGTLGMGAICINSGKDTRIERNIFCQCPRAVGVLVTTAKSWERAMSDIDPGDNEMHATYRAYLYRDINITMPPYSTRYPELARLKQDPSRNRIAHNLVDRCENFVLGLEVQDAQDNVIVEADPGYRDPLHLDLSLPGHAPVSGMGLDTATYRFTVPDLRRRLDIRILLDGRPEKDSAATEAAGRLVVDIVNRSPSDVRTEVEVFGSLSPLHLDNSSVLPVNLAPDQACTHVLSYRIAPPHGHELHLCAQERRRDAVATFVQADVQVWHRLPRLGNNAASLERLAPLIFRDDAGQAVARLRLAAVNDTLAIHAQVDDPRATQDATCWRSQADPWQGPLLGLFFDTLEPSCVRQLVFFPSGPNGDELWYLRGFDQHPAPTLTWQATARAGGYDLTARIPLSAVDLDWSAAGLRLQGMVHVPGSRILPLFGATTSYNNSLRFAIITPDNSLFASSAEFVGEFCRKRA